MARLTKNSYKRKIILFGVLVFMSIALISTGFAAWVMSTNATNDDAQGNVNVGVVKDASLTISEVAIISAKDSFSFEPLAEDTSGRVRYDDEEAKSENLTIKVKGKIAPIEYLGELTYELAIPESVKAAADAGYIVLPECATWEVVQLNGDDDATWGDHAAYYLGLLDAIDNVGNKVAYNLTIQVEPAA